MLLAPVLAEGGFNWTGLAIALVVLALGWTILRFVLRLTLKPKVQHSHCESILMPPRLLVKRPSRAL